MRFPFVFFVNLIFFDLILGYENKSWFIPTPALRPPIAELLTPEQTQETLNYFRKFF